MPFLKSKSLQKALLIPKSGADFTKKKGLKKPHIYITQSSCSLCVTYFYFSPYINKIGDCSESQTPLDNHWIFQKFGS